MNHSPPNKIFVFFNKEQLISGLRCLLYFKIVFFYNIVKNLWNLILKQIVFSFQQVFTNWNSHRLINNTDRTLDIVFSRFRFFVHNNSEAEAQINYAYNLYLSCNSMLLARNSLEILSQGYWNNIKYFN